MKFVYGYKTSDNVRKDGIVDAPSKDAAYAKLKAVGTRPFKVELAPGLLNRIRSLGWRWLAIVILSVAAVGFLVFALQMREEASIALSHGQYADRHQLYGDPAIIEAMEANAYADVFSAPGERYLAFFAQPGRAVSIPNALIAQTRTEDILVACLTNSIAFSSEDPRETTELKQIVNGIKEELRAYCDGGGDIPGFIRALYARQEEESMIYNRVLNELEGNPDSHLWEERNKSLRELGLRTIARPRGSK